MNKDLTQTVPHKMTQIIKLKRQVIDCELESLALSRCQWQTIIWLNILGIPCTQQELLRATEFDRGQLARILDQFEKDKIISRIPMTNDRRIKLINFTKKGQSLASKVAKVIASENSFMLKGFTQKEEDLLHKLLDRMTHNLLEELTSIGE